MESRIRSITLQIAAAEPTAAVEADATAFVRRVFERVDVMLEERAPARVVLLTKVETSWRLLREGLRLPGEEEQIASELARWLHERASALLEAGDGRFGADAECAVLASEAEWRARHWAARSAGERPWWGTALDDEGPLPGALLRANRGTVDDVMGILARRGALAAAVRALSPAALSSLSTRLEVAELQGALSAAARITPMPDGGTVAAVAPPAWLVDALGHIAPSDGPERAALILAGVLVAWEAEERAVSSREREAALALVREKLAPVRGVRGGSSPSAAGASAATNVAYTGFGGLFYLVRLLLELRAGESLFKACLSEPHLLAAAMRLLVDADGVDDPAPEAIGGVDRIALPEPTQLQVQEVCAAGLRPLVEAIPRFGLATFPAVHLSRVDASLLVATPAGSPLALFAWPAESMADVREGLATFLRAWPAAGPVVTASPALAELDRTGRVRPARVRARAPLLPDAGSTWARGLVGQLAGSAAALFALRVGVGDDRVEAIRDRHWRIRGAIARQTDALTLTLPLDAIDLDVRRAGLDRDPGWVPWLQRDVRIVFEES